jgi:hypothetical protein
VSPADSRHDGRRRNDDAGSAVTDLERRYARWTALFYPAAYRRERGSEVVDTYLALSGADRQRPSVADVADLAAGGLRQHLRIAAGLAPGFRLAGLLTLMTATVFATRWTVLEEFVPTPAGPSRVGPFQSLGAVAWVAWLLAAVVHVAAPGRWYRVTARLAVVMTAGVVPAAALTGLPRPPLSVLLPQLVLGVVALGAAGRHPWWLRLMPIAVAVAVGVSVAVGTGFRSDFYLGYYGATGTVFPAVAASLLIIATLLALPLATRRDYRGAWALLILLTPIGMLAVNPLGAMLDTDLGRPIVPPFPLMATVSVLVVVIGPALLLMALTARSRFVPAGQPLDQHAGRCLTCGAPSQPA